MSKSKVITAEEYFANHKVHKFVSYADPEMAHRVHSSSGSKYTLMCHANGHTTTVSGNNKNKDRCIPCEKLEKAATKEAAKPKKMPSWFDVGPTDAPRESLNGSDLEELGGGARTKSKGKDKIMTVKDLEKMQEDGSAAFDDDDEPLGPKEVKASKSSKNKAAKAKVTVEEGPKSIIVPESQIVNISEGVEDEYNGVKFTTVAVKEDRDPSATYIPVGSALILSDVVFINSPPSLISLIASDLKTKTIETKRMTKEDVDKKIVKVDQGVITLILKHFSLDFSKFEGYTLLNDLKFKSKELKSKLPPYMFYAYALLLDGGLITKKTIPALTPDVVLGHLKDSNKGKGHSFDLLLKYVETFFEGDKIEGKSTEEAAKIAIEESDFMKWYLSQRSIAKTKDAKDFKANCLDSDWNGELYNFRKLERNAFKEKIFDLYTTVEGKP